MLKFPSFHPSDPLRKYGPPESVSRLDDCCREKPLFSPSFSHLLNKITNMEFLSFFFFSLSPEATGDSPRLCPPKDIESTGLFLFLLSHPE